MPSNPAQLTIFVCYQCGNPLPAGRKDKKFCGPTCRKRHQRWLDSLDEALTTAKKSIDVLAGSCQFEEVTSQSRQRLKLLRQRIDEHIQVLSIPTK